MLIFIKTDRLKYMYRQGTDDPNDTHMACNNTAAVRGKFGILTMLMINVITFIFYCPVSSFHQGRVLSTAVRGL